TASIIPRAATASISLRIVPDQSLDAVIASLTTHLHTEFARFGSSNRLTVSIEHAAEPWLGDPSNHAFRTLERAVVAEWGGEANGRQEGWRPLYIREGGSIPAARFLEREFGAPAAHLPCGQASDHAHLDNERLRVV